MLSYDDRYDSERDASLVHVAEEMDGVEQERPDDALTCPLLDTPVHFSDCALCGDRGWVTEDQIVAYLGLNRISCLSCGGEGSFDGGGPITWTCDQCLGRGRMPVRNLEDEGHRRRAIRHQRLHGLDLGGLRLDRLVFRACDFTQVNFAGADLTCAKFEKCQFEGANPEAASSLAGTRLRVAGLTEAQRAACVARGAIVVDVPT
jgi:hypothetical protein